MIKIVDNEDSLRARIKVVGVGGGGCNAINRMILSDIKGVEFIAANTDAQALNHSLATYRIQLGEECTKGLGAGGNPEKGREAAEESRKTIEKALEGADMVFVTVGMGGGTGTGASPVFSQIAKEKGILTVVVATKPFIFEGPVRMKQAESGLKDVEGNADTILVIPNQRLLQVIEKNTLAEKAFDRVDDVLRQAVQAITDIITSEATINVDFADVKAIMKDAGKALMGIGEGRGENRAVDAIRQAINSPLLEDVSVNGARGLLVNITGNPKNLTMFEVSTAMELVHKEVSKDVNVFFGQTFDESMEDKLKVTVIATNFEKGKHPKSEMEPTFYTRYDGQEGPESEEDINVPPSLRKK
ncbi:MAG: cell division protein FtsZ [Elusimicrobia bacterium]|nr:cell division protein FtsZ [Elusimicrobiota bacterium]